MINKYDYKKTKCAKCSIYIKLYNFCLCNSNYCDECLKNQRLYGGHAFHIFDDIKLYCCDICHGDKISKKFKFFHNVTADINYMNK